MSKEFMSPATLPPPVGYSHIAKVSKGTLIYLAKRPTLPDEREKIIAAEMRRHQ